MATYNLKDNAGGKLALVGKEIRAASALTTGTLNYTVTATDNGWTKDFTGTITVDAAGVSPLALSNNSYETRFQPGYEIGTVSGMAAGSVLKVFPNDARIVTSGNRVLVGLTAASTGTFSATLREVKLDGSTRDLAVTFNVNTTALTPLNAMNASVKPKAIYALRKINAAYTGACCQVRDSTNTLRTVQFDANGDVSQAQFAAWGDGVTFTVATWYDQSGNGYNLASASRPPLVLSAYTDAKGVQRPAVNFASKGHILSTSAAQFTSGGTTNLSTLVICNTLGYASNTTPAPRPGTFATSLVAPVISFGSTSAGREITYAADDPLRAEGADPSSATTFMRLRETVLDRGNVTGTGYDRYRNFWYNQRGAVVSGGIDSRMAFRNREHRAAQLGPDVLTLGTNAARTVTYNGHIQEVIIYNDADAALADSECQRIALEQRAYWGTQLTNGTYDPAADSYRPATFGTLERGDWALASDGIHPPIQSANYSTEAYETSLVSGVTPAYGVKQMRWAWSNWWTINDGGEPPERDTGNNIAVRAALFADGAKVADLTFGGAAEVTIASGGDAWCDVVTLPATWTKKRYEIRTYIRYTGTRPGNYRLSTEWGNVSRKCANDAEALAFLNSGTPTDNQFQNGVYFYGPSLAISDGWDGRPVALVMGDSIAFGSYEARSWVTSGLGTTYGGIDVPYANFAVQGTRPANSYTIAPGIAQRKDQLLRSAINFNGGRTLWTAIISEHGVNDAGGTNGGQLTSKVFDGFLRYMHYRFRPASVALMQTTYTPRVQPNADTAWLYSYPDTTASTTSDPASDRWKVSDLIIATTWPLSGYIDVREAWTGSKTGTKWREGQGTGTLTAAAAIGATQLTVSSRPSLGDTAVPGAGSSATVEQAGQITAITGSGPFVITLDTPTTKAHASGEAIRYATTGDGVHPTPGTMGWKLAAQAVADAKTRYLDYSMARTADGSVGTTYTVANVFNPQWCWADGTNIADATGTSYTAQPSDAGKQLAVKDATGVIRARAPGRVLSAPILLEGFGDLTGFTASGGNALTVDTVNKIQGVGSLVLSDNGTTGSPEATKLNVITADPSTFGVVAAYFDAGSDPEYMNNTQHTFALTNAAGGALTQNTVTNKTVNNSILGGDWLAYNVSEVSSLMTGGSRALGVKVITGAVAPFAGTTRVDAAVRNAKGHPTVLLTFDDARPPQFTTGKSILDASNLKASFYLPTDLMGEVDRLSWANARQLSGEGHDMALDGHPRDVSMTGEPDLATTMSRFMSQRDALVAQGISLRAWRHTCYPNGAIRAAATPIVKTVTTDGTTTVLMSDTSSLATGMRAAGAANTDRVANGVTIVSINANVSVELSAVVPSGITSMSFTITSNQFHTGKIQTALQNVGVRSARQTNSGTFYSRFNPGYRPIIAPGVATTEALVSGSWDLSVLMAYVNQCELRGNTVIFYTHAFDTSSGLNTDATFYSQFCQALKARQDAGALDVLTLSQWDARDLGSTIPL